MSSGTFRFGRRTGAALLVLGSLGVFAPGFPASAETSLAQTTLPGAVEPGRIERRFEEPLLPKSRDEGFTIPEQEDTTRPPDGADKVEFVLRGIVVEGATVFAEADFLPLYEKHLGGKVALTVVYEIAAAITRMYADAGYVLAQALVPAQRINGNGIVRIRVLEGYVDKVLIEGEVEGRRALLEEMGRKIAASRPLKASVLERYLLLADDLHGATVQGVLKPSPNTPGAANLVLAVSHKTYDAFVNFDNRGTKYTGPLQFTLGGTANSVLGLYEKTSLQVVTSGDTNELRYVSLGHDQILNSEGTGLGVTLGGSLSEPGATLTPSDINSRNVSFSATVKHPVIRSRPRTLNVKGTFDYKNSTTDQNDNRLSEDRVRAIRFGVDYDFTDAWLPTPAMTIVTGELSRGLNILGSRPSGSDNLTRPRGVSDFHKATMGLTRIQQLPLEGVGVMFGMSAQYSPGPLLSSEEFSFGGSSFGRGLDSSEISGDSGVAVKVELQRSGSLNPEGPYMKGYQLYGFYDFGSVWNHDADDEGDNPQTATTVGFGVRANVTDWASLTLELGFPLTHAAGARVDKGDGKDPRFHFGLMMRY